MSLAGYGSPAAATLAPGCAVNCCRVVLCFPGRQAVEVVLLPCWSYFAYTVAGLQLVSPAGSGWVPAASLAKALLHMQLVLQLESSAGSGCSPAAKQEQSLPCMQLVPLLDSSAGCGWPPAATLTIALLSMLLVLCLISPSHCAGPASAMLGWNPCCEGCWVVLGCVVKAARLLLVSPAG